MSTAPTLTDAANELALARARVAELTRQAHLEAEHAKMERNARQRRFAEAVMSGYVATTEAIRAALATAREAFEAAVLAGDLAAAATRFADWHRAATVEMEHATRYRNAYSTLKLTSGPHGENAVPSPTFNAPASFLEAVDRILTAHVAGIHTEVREAIGEVYSAYLAGHGELTAALVLPGLAAPGKRSR